LKSSHSEPGAMSHPTQFYKISRLTFWVIQQSDEPADSAENRTGDDISIYYCVTFYVCCWRTPHCWVTETQHKYWCVYRPASSTSTSPVAASALSSCTKHFEVTARSHHRTRSDTTGGQLLRIVLVIIITVVMLIVVKYSLFSWT